MFLTQGFLRSLAAEFQSALEMFVPGMHPRPTELGSPGVRPSFNTLSGFGKLCKTSVHCTADDGGIY